MSDPFFNWYQTVERARRYEETVLQHASLPSGCSDYPTADSR